MHKLEMVLRVVGVVCRFAWGSGAVQAQEPDIYHPLAGQALAPAPDGGVYVAGSTSGTLGPEPEVGKGHPVAEPIQPQDTDVCLAQVNS